MGDAKHPSKPLKDRVGFRGEANVDLMFPEDHLSLAVVVQVPNGEALFAALLAARVRGILAGEF